MGHETAAMAHETATDLECRLAQAQRELSEAREQLAATSEVLRIISSSLGDLEPVFQTMLQNATRLCEANFGNLYVYQDGELRLAASHNVPHQFAEARGRAPIRPRPGTVLGDVIRTQQIVHVADLAAIPAYLERIPTVVEAVELGGVRSIVGVPMLRENELIGAIAIYRQEVRPFTDKQIALVESFARQAVIAIENTRLLNELRQRTDDLGEALEQQTATSEVLGVISSSPGELDPMFVSMLTNATRLCGAKFGSLYLCEGENLRKVATHNAPPAYAEARPLGSVVSSRSLSAMGRMMRTKQVVHIADIRADEAYAKRDPLRVAAAELAGARSVLCVPMLKDDKLIGGIGIYRQEVRQFTDKQIELVSNFAKQAVIGIENARLLNELRESLQQQTATADVLKVISSSPGELEPVFQAMLENAARVCGAKFGVLWLPGGDGFRAVALHGVPPAYAEARRRDPG
jgi:GAF domain-containing protein